jgi:hypothetical protein
MAFRGPDGDRGDRRYGINGTDLLRPASIRSFVQLYVVQHIRVRVFTTPSIRS